MKIHQILLQLQLNLFSSIGKLHLLWCMDNIHSIFYNTFWISNFHCNCIGIFNSMISIRYYCSSNSIFLLNWKITFIVMYGQYSVHIYRYTLNFKFSLILYLYHSSQWRFIRYYCSSNSIFLVQLENYIYCDVWTILSKHFSNTLWISSFYWNCIYIFNSMKIYQILLQLQLKLFSSNWKLNTMWCIDNIQSTLYKYTLNFKFSLQLYLYI